MNQLKKYGLSVLGLFLITSVLGCRDQSPHSFHLPRGHIHRKHGKPPAGSYYKNWDPYAVSIDLKPAADLNPVKTQHVLVATVKDANGVPLPNRRVEWIISQGSVGDIVEVDESGVFATRGYKETNHYAISHTNNYDHVLTRGNNDSSDDVYIKKGQTWCVITSPIEGETHIVAYAPSIYNWDKHKAFATKNWYDVKFAWPPPMPSILRGHRTAS